MTEILEERLLREAERAWNDAILKQDVEAAQEFVAADSQRSIQTGMEKSYSLHAERGSWRTSRSTLSSEDEIQLIRCPSTDTETP